MPVPVKTIALLKEAEVGFHVSLAEGNFRQLNGFGMKWVCVMGYKGEAFNKKKLLFEHPFFKSRNNLVMCKGLGFRV